MKRMSAVDFEKETLEGFEGFVEIWDNKVTITLAILKRPTELIEAEFDLVNDKLQHLQDNKDKILKQVVSETFEERLNRSLTRDEFTAGLKLDEIEIDPELIDSVTVTLISPCKPFDQHIHFILTEDNEVETITIDLDDDE